MPRWITSLLFLVLCTPFVAAGEIKWTATGTVDLVFGPGLSGVAVVSDPVQVEFSYSDAALREPLAISEFPGLWSHLEYRENVDIDLKVIIGANTWQGILGSGSKGTPRAIEVQDYNVGPETTDFFKLAVSAGDGGVFPFFPGVAVGASTLLNVEFSDGTDTTAGPDYLGSNRLDCVAQAISRITAAKGSITDGVGEVIRYVIDPASLATEIVGVGTFALTGISFANDEVTLTWPSQPGRFYIIQYLDEFLCWREVISVFAIEAETSETFFPAGVGVAKTQLYRVVEDE